MRGYRALLLAGSVSAIALSAPAYAQEEGASSGSSDDNAIIVTGSRIQRKDFESSSPVVTVNDAFLKQTSTAAIETQLNKLPQFTPAKTPTSNSGDIQPTATNTPGSATISLRGLGSNRNLVLIDGRRGTPANAAGAVDISTIPPLAIERVEIISGGASATYGADAIAGVTNFILKKNYQGLELDGQAGITEHGDGFEYQLGGIMGADFADSRGNVMLSMSMNRRNASYQKDRSWYRDLWANPDVAGTGFFFEQPGIYFGFDNLPSQAAINAAFPGATVPNSNVTVYANGNGSPFVSGSFNPPPLFGYTPYFAGFDQSQIDNYNYKVTNAGTLAKNDTYLQLVVPETRYNFLARGNYEINDWIGVFAQASFSQVSTHTLQEPGPIVNGWGVNIDPDTITDHSLLPQAFWDLLNSRPDPGAPFTLAALMPDPREGFSDVTTYNVVAGLEGFIPSTDWTWDASVNRGVSSTYVKQTGIYSLSRLKTVLQSGNFGRGFSQTGNPEQGGFGASTATCTSGLDFFDPPAGGFSQDCIDAITADLKNRGKTTQTIAEANLQGKVIDLPAGELRAALGASYRKLQYQFDNDTLTTQGESFQDQALGIYPSGNVDASFDVKELYGELLVPILHDIPGIKHFDLELGGRISNYSTTGTSYTYKALADWKVTDWLQLSGGYNRAERAPNLAELYLSPQQTFAITTVGDPCSRLNPYGFSANPAKNPTYAANVEATCRALMDATGDPGAKSAYYSSPQSNATFGFAFPSLVGNPNLEPEKADTWTAKMVISSPFSSPLLSRLRLAISYYDIKVNNAIGAQTVDIALRQCFDAGLNPLILTDPAAAAATQFCQNVPRVVQNGGLGNVRTTYVNNGRFHTNGIDLNLDWSTDVGPGTLAVDMQGTYLLHFWSAALPTDAEIDYAGTQGPTDNGVDGGNYRWRLLTNLNYSIGKVMVGLQWQHLPSIASQSSVQLAAAGTPFGSPGNTTLGVPVSYDLFALTAAYAVTDKINIRFGIDNLFNKSPVISGANPANTSPLTTGNLIGGSLSGDTIGRRFYLGVNTKF
ncbi:MAG: TonB-dependent receptor [Novosphingobium sp.]|nr:TonB-dependent receptor [Novosphingobium sp.]